MRELSYPEAILEGTRQLMASDARVLLMGLGVNDPQGVQGTTLGLAREFGEQRVFDTPLSEDAMTGAAVGMAMAGLRPIHVHIRMDFLLLAMNQLINMAAKMRHMSGGQLSAPLVVRAMIGKSWGQGPQHSQGLHALLAHIPGLKVVAPTTPHDAKGCLAAAVEDEDPVIFMEHRLLHYQRGPVPEALYAVSPGSGGRVTGEGEDITLVGVSYMQLECLRARHELRSVGIRAEVIDPIWLAPLDVGTVARSVLKTGRLLVVDSGWVHCGMSSSIVAAVVEAVQDQRRVAVRRMGFEAVTCPTTPALERHFYPSVPRIAAAAYEMVKGDGPRWSPEEREYPEDVLFKGPF